MLGCAIAVGSPRRWGCRGSAQFPFREIRGEDPIKIAKGKIREMASIPPEHQRLIFAGKQLLDDRTMADYNVRKGSILHLVLRPPKT